MAPSKKITFCPLASGSKGNSIFIETPETSLLFDVGLSMKAIHDRLRAIGKSIESIDAIIITHEHHDHISGLKSITTKYNIPVIANFDTAEAVVETLGGDWCPKFHIFTTGEPFEWKDVEITPFSVQHDGVDPVAFSLKAYEKKISLCTDLGFATTSVKHHLKQSNILYIESNHRPEMVHASSRPESYKKRVLGRTGHLSNEECARVIADSAHNSLQQVYLAHLSSECNSEYIAKDTINSFLDTLSISLPIDIAYQDDHSKITTLDI